ncbi:MULTISPECIES: ATP-binding protein [Streptomyces]|uniref:ATP-binding protein n=1 Tax=Streptomyces TaxID=1883 RepID=UPI00386D92E1
MLAAVDDGWAEEVVLVADELVGNAHQHVRAEGPMGITVDLHNWGVVVQVHDSGTNVTAISCEPTHPTLEQVSGRGLFLVNALASAWSVRRTERGKSVTAIFLSTGGWR